jgi:hypothetical protein
MQSAPLAPEQGGVYRLLDQGMGEEVMVFAPWARQMLPDQAGTVVIPSLDQVAQCLGGEALAEDRSRLQRPLVERVESIHARQHEALNRPGHARGRLGTVFGAEQKLLQEQRLPAARSMQRRASSPDASR